MSNPVTRTILDKRVWLISILCVLFFGGRAFDLVDAVEVDTLRVWAKQNPDLFVILFVVGYCVLTVFLMPTLPLNLAAGFIWGPHVGCIVTILGATGGAAISFLLARHAMRDFALVRFQESPWKELFGEVIKYDWKAVAFARLNPVFPSGPLNYFFGLSAVSFIRFLLASIVFVAPIAYTFSYLGHIAGGIALGQSHHLVLESVLGCSAFISLAVLLKVFSKVYLRVKKK
jgi:uncharacterized membrane protein YdjX (TVP38/TMEM64 family)